MKIIQANNKIEYIIFILLVGFGTNIFAASSILIWPLGQTIEDTDKATSLWIQNNDKQSVFLQIRVLKWQQQDGEESLVEQTEIVASPPVAEVQPDKKQLIRLVKNINIPANTENAYRVLIDEIPRADVKSENISQGYGVAFQMRYSVPLFVQGNNIWTNQDYRKPRDINKATLPVLDYKIQNKEGKSWLVITNKGEVHARLAKVFFKQNNQVYTVSDGLLGYVLPNRSMSFAIPASVKTTGTLFANINEMPNPITINHQ